MGFGGGGAGSAAASVARTFAKWPNQNTVPGITYFLYLCGCFDPLLAQPFTTTENRVSQVCGQSATWRRMGIHIDTHAAGTGTMRSRIDGVNGSQVINVPAAGTGYFEDATNTDSLVGGEELDFSLISVGGNIGDNLSWYSEFTT